jgi:hypothetical protein
MLHRISTYPLMEAEGRAYRPRAYGDQHSDGVWDGWLVFFPTDGGIAIASDRETTQPSLSALEVWAAGLSDVYLVGALNRALRIAEQPPVLTSLARAEYDALADAERAEAAAEVDQVAATSARNEARAIARERVAVERELAGAEASAASAEARVHEEAAKAARAVAADARQRRRRRSRKVPEK